MVMTLQGIQIQNQGPKIVNSQKMRYMDGENPSNEGGLSDGVDDISEGDQSESDDSREVVDESDSSKDEVDPRNTIGDVPLEWYKEEEHIGYDVAGKKIKKKERLDKLDSFLARTDDSNSWRKITDDVEDEDVELTKCEEVNSKKPSTQHCLE